MARRPGLVQSFGNSLMHVTMNSEKERRRWHPPALPTPSPKKLKRCTRVRYGDTMMKNALVFPIVLVYENVPLLAAVLV
jgi:hypothetical protein